MELTLFYQNISYQNHIYIYDIYDYDIYMIYININMKECICEIEILKRFCKLFLIFQIN